MKTSSRNTIHRRNRFEHLNYRLKTGLLILSSLIILVSLGLALSVFSYIFSLATHPQQAQVLVDQWAQVFNRTDSPNPVLPILASPARWFAVFTLGILGFFVTRIPFLLLQMGIQLFAACHNEPPTREVLRELLTEINRDKLR